MDPALLELLADEEAPDVQQIEAIIRLRQPGVAPPGVRLVANFGHISTCRLDATSIRRVWAHPGVLGLKASRPLTPGTDPQADAEAAAGPPLRATDVRRPAGLPLTGAGVVVGIVDWGLDPSHPDFLVNNRTRVMALWDQRGTPSRSSPAPYGYGTVHSRRALEAALRTAAPFAALGYHPSVSDPRRRGAHGTHVAAIAAGNGGAGGPTGVAPESDLVFVHLADRGTNGRANLGDSVRLLEAVHFVAHAAGRRPWVVNLSLGRHGGPHDGSTLVERALDEFLAARPGRFVVQSAGNYHDARTHARGTVVPGDVQRLTFVTDPTDRTTNELEIWYDVRDEFLLRICMPGQRTPTTVPLGQRAVLTTGRHQVGRVYHRAFDPNGSHHIDAFLDPGAPPGLWRVDLAPVRVVNGRFHAWLERDDAGQTRFSRRVADPTTTVGTIANGRVPLVVGAYDPHTPALPVYLRSSAGPTRDGRVKPDIAAPGVQILSARSTPRGTRRSPGGLVRKSGTSMAAPYVTGAVALCLQATAASPLTARQIRDLVLRTARPLGPREDPMRLGRGRIDLRALVSHALRSRPAPRRSTPTEEQDMDVTTDLTRQLHQAPARCFRELVYRPEGPLGQRVADRFAVLGRAGQEVTDPRDGDVLLSVALGQPDRGTCTVLSPGVSVPSRLAPGQVLLRARTARRPAPSHPPLAEQSSEEGGDNPPLPGHVVCARGVWQRLMGLPEHRADRALMARVTLLDLADIRSSEVRQIPNIVAWTNSPRTIFVAPKPCIDLFWEAVLEHELIHVRQFHSKGRRPANYAEMIRFECDAYRESIQWCRRQTTRTLDAQSKAILADVQRQMTHSAQLLCREISSAIAARLGSGALNARYKKFLITQDFLPPHKDLGVLYPRSGTVRGDDGADSDDIASEDDPFETTLARIRAELMRQFTDPNDPGLVARRRRLRALFEQVPGDRTRELHDRLGLRATSDSLSRLFHHRLATPTRAELLAILRRRFPRVTPPARTPTPVLVAPSLPLPTSERARFDAAVAALQSAIRSSSDPRAWRYQCWLAKLASGGDDRVVPWFRICPRTSGAIGAAFVVGPCDITAGQAVNQAELESSIRGLADVEVANRRLQFITHLRSQIVWTVELTSPQFHVENFRGVHDQVQLTLRNLDLWANSPMGGSSAMPHAYRAIMAWIRAQQGSAQSVYSCM